MIIAFIFAIGTIIFVVVDLIFEKRDKKDEKAVAEPAPEAEEALPDEEPEPIPVPFVLTETVESIDAEHADELLTDEEAASIVKTEEGAGEGPRNYINIGIINEHFEAGDTVTLNILKEKGLIDKKIMRIKILADGILDRPLTVKAESFSIQAVKMIELTGGTVIVLK